MTGNQELFFPPQLLSELADLQDAKWQKFVERIAALPETHPDKLALSLVVIQLGGCMSCGPGSFRHMKGCASCARQAVGSFKGGTAKLMEMFEEARTEVQQFLGEKKAQIAA